MRALYRNLLVSTLCVAVSVFMFDGVSQAKKGGNSSSKVKIDVRAELEPPDGSPEDDAKGKMRHQKETRKEVLKKDEFKGNVKMRAHPASALGIVDEASAENADIRLILSRPGDAPFAECRLEFDEIDEDDDDDELQAVFKIHVRMKKGTVQDKKGTCGGSIPDARDGDVATVMVNGTATPFLEGTFEQH